MTTTALVTTGADGPGLSLADEIACLAAHLDAASHRLLTCIRRFDESGEWHQQGALSCAHWLTWRINLDPGTAREKVRVARALGALPHIDDALRRGVLSYAKTRALTRVATTENEQRLLQMALFTTGAQLERLCRQVRRVVDEVSENDNGTGTRLDDLRYVDDKVLPNGLVRLTAVLHPDEAALILKAIESARRLPPASADRDELALSDATPEAARAGDDVSAEAPRALPSHDVSPATKVTGTDVSAEAPLMFPSDDVSPATKVSRTDVSAEAPRTLPSHGVSPATKGSAADVSAEAARTLLSHDVSPATEASSADDSAETPRTPPSHDVSPATKGSRADGSAETRRMLPRVDALVRVAEAFLAHSDAAGCGGDRTQIFLHVDQDPLAPDGTLAATLDDGTRVCSETFRRLACDAALVTIVHGTDGGTSLSPRTRTIAPALRRALHLRDRGCRFPGCTNRLYVHAHHIHHWVHGGPTTAENLLLLCSGHHRLVHEGGLHVERTPDGDIAFLDRHHRPVPANATPWPVGNDGAATVRAWNAEQDLDITPDTNLNGWDGDPVDYDGATEAVLWG